MFQLFIKASKKPIARSTASPYRAWVDEERDPFAAVGGDSGVGGCVDESSLFSQPANTKTIRPINITRFI
jgi:hypothetical protein